MQTVAEITADTLKALQNSTLIKSPTRSSDSASQEDVNFNRLINMIFTTLTLNFPDWATKHLADDNNRLRQKRLWRYALDDLTISHVKNGIENMVKTCEFPPRPAAFRKLSFQIRGVPDLSRAFTEALSGNYSCKLVKRAAELTGIFDLRRGTETDTGLRKRYEYNHTQLVNKLMRGESIDGPVTKAIENTQKAVSFGGCDDLLDQEIKRQQSSGKSGYEEFKALKNKGARA